MTWSLPFDDPMLGGIVTLRDGANLITKLSKAEQAKPHWQAAAEALIMAAEDDGPILHARVGMLRAMNYGRGKPVRGKKTSRKYRIV